jgi:cytidylate kinase
MRAGHEVRIITVSRESGAGGAYVAHALGRRLGWPVVDKTLVEEVARRLQAPLTDVEGMDEYAGGLLQRLGKVFAQGGPELVLTPNQPDPDDVARVELEVIRNVAESPPVIVVGRGAQCVLHDRPDAFHLRLVAPLEVRAKRLAEARGVPLEQAREQARHVDSERDRYLHRHFRCERNNPHLYDLQVNTGGIPLDEAVEIVLGVVQAHRAAAN